MLGCLSALSYCHVIGWLAICVNDQLKDEPNKGDRESLVRRPAVKLLITLLCENEKVNSESCRLKLEQNLESL